MPGKFSQGTAHPLLCPEPKENCIFPLTFPFFSGGSKAEDTPMMAMSTFRDSLDCEWCGGWRSIQRTFPSFPQHGEHLSRGAVPSEQLTHMGEQIYPLIILSGRKNISTATRKRTAERLSNLPKVKD